MAFKMFQNKYERVLDTVFVYWESLWKFSARNKALNDDKICTKLTYATGQEMSSLQRKRGKWVSTILKTYINYH